MQTIQAKQLRRIQNTHTHIQDQPTKSAKRVLQRATERERVREREQHESTFGKQKAHNENKSFASMF